MKPELKFEIKKMKRGRMGEAASTPDLGGTLIMQNHLKFHLDETDEIYEGYGTLPTSFPYRQQTVYSREIELMDTKVATLENDFVKAVFLPEFGGRLWYLEDKTTGTDLLYTNDVIRFSNLAIRNAWFSGGVEWNIGIIGHSPLTNEPLHTAKLVNQNGDPILRMYAYERIREVEYQMDFWLGKEDHMLNCRMRIVNHNKEVVPMYWWSNMAVPEYEEGRVIVPAKEAYSCVDWEVYKRKIPYVDGLDVSFYNTIPDQVDYFFDIPEESPKFVANVNKEGYGLLQVSTKRLRSRKLFSWGNNKGSDRWQEYLTENAGRYVEIQAGLGKTQYGCIPMAPHCAWEWLEQYGPVSLSPTEKGFEVLQEEAMHYVNEKVDPKKLEQLLKDSKKDALTKGEVVYKGTEHGALKQVEIEVCGTGGLSEHLDFGSCEKEYAKVWAEFLKTKKLPVRDAKEIPEDFQCSRAFYEALKEAAKKDQPKNWYVHYQLGLAHWFHQEVEKAKEELLLSLRMEENPWSCHALAMLSLEEKNTALTYTLKGLELRNDDLSYVKEMFRILLSLEAYEEEIEEYEKLDEAMQKESRLRYDYLLALAGKGEYQKGYEILMEEPKFDLVDIREGEDSLGSLYQILYEGVYKKSPKEVPQRWNFNSL